MKERIDKPRTFKTCPELFGQIELKAVCRKCGAIKANLHRFDFKDGSKAFLECSHCKTMTAKLSALELIQLVSAT